MKRNCRSTSGTFCRRLYPFTEVSKYSGLERYQTCTFFLVYNLDDCFVGSPVIEAVYIFFAIFFSVSYKIFESLSHSKLQSNAVVPPFDSRLEPFVSVSKVEKFSPVSFWCSFRVVGKVMISDWSFDRRFDLAWIIVHFCHLIFRKFFFDDSELLSADFMIARFFLVIYWISLIFLGLFTVYFVFKCQVFLIYLPSF